MYYFLIIEEEAVNRGNQTGSQKSWVLLLT